MTGDHPLCALEAGLAAHKGTEAALVFGSGYLANLGITPALAGRGDLVLLDELSHACMWAGARLSGATVLTFRHNDPPTSPRGSRSTAPHHGRALVLTERVFSMDGDRAPLGDILGVAEAFDAWTLVDDAHGIGVVEDGPRAPLEMGTLSKALGSYGGYLCASRPVIDLMTSRARSFVYTTGLPPASAAAALEALAILEAEPGRRARPLALARRFTARLGLPEAESAVVPVLVGEAQAALDISAAWRRPASWSWRSVRRPSRPGPRGCGWLLGGPRRKRRSMPWPTPSSPCGRRDRARTFSSEVDAGSHEENVLGREGGLSRRGAPWGRFRAAGARTRHDLSRHPDRLPEAVDRFGDRSLEERRPQHRRAAPPPRREAGTGRCAEPCSASPGTARPSAARRLASTISNA